MTTTRRKLSDFKPDTRNANKGTARGKRALKSSLSRLGAGRSILVDKNGTVIAGNKTLESAKAAGITDVIVVPSDGTKLVAVQRLDIDLAEDPRARELAYADNRVAELDLEWDAEQVAKDMEAGLSLPEDLFTPEELAALSPTEEPETPREYSSIVSYTIIFDDQDQQARFHAFLRYLKEKYPETETIGARIDKYLQERATEIKTGE
jgi:hypothetical protein